MRNFYYAFVFRFHNSGDPVSFEMCVLSVKVARDYYQYLRDRYDYVEMFKQFD